MQHVLLLPTPLLLLFATLFVGLCLALALLALKWGPRILRPIERNVPVPAFMGVVATAWALSLSFAASDIWSLSNRADQAIAAERSSVMRLVGAAAPAALDIPELYDSVLSYVQQVEKNERVQRLDRALGDPLVDAAIQNIRLAVLSSANSGISEAVGAKIVNDFDELQDARNARLGINISLIDPSKWYLLLSFTFLTTITIALLHMDRPVAGRTAATIFSITALAGLWILAIHVDPLSGIRDDYLSYGLPSASAKG